MIEGITFADHISPYISEGSGLKLFRVKMQATIQKYLPLHQ